MTWTIEPSDRLADHDVIVESLGAFYAAFAESLDTDLALEEVLPFYARKLPYYQRLYANALSRSIRGSVTIGGQGAKPAREWRLELPNTDPGSLLGKA